MSTRLAWRLPTSALRDGRRVDDVDRSADLTR
jgi:hypothetical protein